MNDYGAFYNEICKEPEGRAEKWPGFGVCWFQRYINSTGSLSISSRLEKYDDIIYMEILFEVSD